MGRFKVTVDGRDKPGKCCYCNEELTYNPVADQYYHKAQRTWTWQELSVFSASPACDIREIEQKLSIKPTEVMATTDVCPERFVEWWLRWDGKTIKPRMVILGP